METGTSKTTKSKGGKKNAATQVQSVEQSQEKPAIDTLRERAKMAVAALKEAIKGQKAERAAGKDARTKERAEKKAAVLLAKQEKKEAREKTRSEKAAAKQQLKDERTKQRAEKKAAREAAKAAKAAEPPKPRPTKLPVEAIVNAYKNGVSIAKIAESQGVSYMGVRLLLIREKVFGTVQPAAPAPSETTGTPAGV